jgi:hypothetical protein
LGFVVKVGASLRLAAPHAIRRETLILDLFQLLAGEGRDSLSDANIIASLCRRRTSGRCGKQAHLL